MSISATLGATCAFLVGRYLARGWVARRIEGNAKFKAIDEAVAREGWKIVGLTRLSPVFPFNLLNYAFSLTNGAVARLRVRLLVGNDPGHDPRTSTSALWREASPLWERASDSARRPSGLFTSSALLATVGVTVFVTRVARGALESRVGGGSGTAGQPA